MNSYEAPRVDELGSVAELTEYKNKIGPTPDVGTASTGISGSIVTVNP